MNLDRRTFIKLTGLGLLALAAKPAIDLLSRPEIVRAISAGNASPKRWAMAVDLKACTADKGCRDCIVACHKVHNVPDIGTRKEEIKWIWPAAYHEAFPEQGKTASSALASLPVLLLCNHCDNPPCVRVCPTQATWRRDDGIVMMDYHRFIGCRYCMAACPYGSRSFNWRDPQPYIKEVDLTFAARTRGVVEKCNFCEERLAQGRQPACVEACKYNALVFGDMQPASDLYRLVSSNFSILRKPELGTRQQVYYIP